ncbi:hypothetical protein KJZ99_07900 [bacterium]|nr:hypothetical protein [bacterium]
MRNKRRKFRGGRKLALILVLFLAVGAKALNVVNTHTSSGSLSKSITVTTAGTYKHDALAPAQGYLYSEIENRTAIPSDDIYVENGECVSHSVYLEQTDERTFYNLNSTATITSGTAKSQVRSQEIVTICPSGGGS